MKTTFVDRLQPFRGRSLKAFIWVHYNYKNKKHFYFISCTVRKKIIFLKFILLVISELCLVYHNFFYGLCL